MRACAGPSVSLMSHAKYSMHACVIPYCYMMSVAMILLLGSTDGWTMHEVSLMSPDTLTVWLLLPSSRRFEFNIMNGKWEVSMNEASFFWHANESSLTHPFILRAHRDAENELMLTIKVRGMPIPECPGAK